MSADGGFGTRVYGLNLHIQKTSSATCKTSVTMHSLPLGWPNIGKNFNNWLAGGTSGIRF